MELLITIILIFVIYHIVSPIGMGHWYMRPILQFFVTISILWKHHKDKQDKENNDE